MVFYIKFKFKELSHTGIRKLFPFLSTYLCKHNLCKHNCLPRTIKKYKMN